MVPRSSNPTTPVWSDFDNTDSNMFLAFLAYSQLFLHIPYGLHQFLTVFQRTQPRLGMLMPFFDSSHHFQLVSSFAFHLKQDKALNEISSDGRESISHKGMVPRSTDPTGQFGPILTTLVLTCSLLFQSIPNFSYTFPMAQTNFMMNFQRTEPCLGMLRPYFDSSEHFLLVLSLTFTNFSPQVSSKLTWIYSIESSSGQP